MNENLTKAKINLKEGVIELEGSQEFVQNNLDVFKDFIFKPAVISNSAIISKPIDEPPIETKTSNSIRKQSKSSVVDNVPPESFDIGGKNGEYPPFKDFLDDKKPSHSSRDMIAVTGFYLQSYLGKTEFSEGNVMYAYVVKGAKRPKNVHQTFINVKNLKQWIQQGSSTDKWILTQLGDDHVLHDLPKTKK